MVLPDDLVLLQYYPDTNLLTPTLQMAGAGKVPYLSLEAASLDFGEVLLGKSSEASVRFGNHSQVPAHFTVVHETLPGAEKSGRLLGKPEVYSITPMR